MQRRLLAWLAIFGIACNALWPLVANAAPVDIDATICSVGKTAATAQPAPVKGIPASSSLPHCPFCLGVSDSTPGLAAAPFVFYDPVVATLSAAIAGTFGAATFTHPSAAPRGPPASP